MGRRKCNNRAPRLWRGPDPSLFSGRSEGIVKARESFISGVFALVEENLVRPCRLGGKRRVLRGLRRDWGW